MPSTATARLRIEKQNTGENLNTWGTKLNTTALDLLDEAIGGFVAVAVAANVVLTATNYASDQARKKSLRFTGAGGFNVTIPAVEKSYFVHNACAAAVTVTAGGGTNAVVQPGEIVIVYCDGAAVYRGLLLHFGNQRLQAVADPVDATDAANRQYVLAQFAALGIAGWALKTGAYNAAIGDRLLCDTTGAAFTVTLPSAGLALGSEITVADMLGTWATNALIVGRNGNTISGLAQDMVCDLPGSRVSFVWTGATWACFS